MIPAIFCWSGGKDSAHCLYKVLQEKKYDVKILLTTVNQQFRRVSMHGVREEVLDEQAKQIGIPLVKVYVNEGTNAEYEKKMEETLLRFRSEGIHHVIFGDIYLEDLRKYREDNLAKVGMKAVFPLWKGNPDAFGQDADIYRQHTRKLLEEFLTLKFKTIICCTNDAYLGEEWAGRIIDDTFIASIPANADACGENGEYHTFCFDGPLFKNPINISAGEKIYKPLVIKTTDDCSLPASATKGFWFCDLIKKD